MSDLGTRALIVLGVVIVAVLAISVLRYRSSSATRIIKAPGLGPGTYFFTSSACADCSPARERLVARHGASGFVEYSWERDREILEALRVDRVPSTLVVEDSGTGTLWTGVPEPMISPVDP